MAEGKKSFIAYCDWKETFNALPDEYAGKLVKHLFAYVSDECPESDDLIIKAVFANIKQTLKRDLKKYDNIKIKRSLAGKISGDIRKQKGTKRTSVNKPEQTSTKRTDNGSVNDSVNDNVIVTEEKKKECNIIPPPVFLIAKYCKDRNNGINADYFYDWYQTRGWKVGKDKMKDWQSAIRTWEKRNEARSSDTPKLSMP
jgi:hypothetical protein